MGHQNEEPETVKLLLLWWVLLAVVLALVAWIVPDVDIDGGLFGVLVAAAIFGLVNAVVGPVLRLLSLPITMVTFGLFSLVVNGLLLALTAGLTSFLDVGGLFQTIVAAFLISVLNTLTHFVVIRMVTPGPTSQTTAV
jgi:putative membrane protein